MEEQGIRHLPVMEEGRLVSVITDREVKLALDPGLGRSPRDDLVVRDLCVPNVYIVEPTEPLDAALMHMAHHRFDAALGGQGRQAGGHLHDDRRLPRSGESPQDALPVQRGRRRLVD